MLEQVVVFLSDEGNEKANFGEFSIADVGKGLLQIN